MTNAPKSGAFMAAAMFMVAAAIGIIAVAVASMSITRGHGWSDDYAGYILQAESIVAGTTEAVLADGVHTNTMGRPQGPIAYPWGVPLLLSAIIRCHGLNLFLMKFLNIGCFVLSLLVFFAILKVRMPSTAVLLCVGVVAFNPMTIWFQDMIGSEFPFMLVQMLTILVMERFLSVPRSPARAICIGILAGLSYLIRSNGVLLILTLLIVHSFEVLREWRRDRTFLRRCGWITAALPYAAFAGLVISVSVWLPLGGAGHCALFRKLNISYILNQVTYYTILCPSSYFDKLPFPMLLYGICLPMFLKGIACHRREDRLIMIYCGLTLCLYVFWPSRQNVRFLLPIMPFFIYFTLRGMPIGGWRFNLRNPVTVLALGFVVCLVGVSLRSSLLMGVVNMRGNRDTGSGPFDDDGAAMARFVTQNTQDDAVVGFFKPRIMRLVTGRRSFEMSREDRESVKDAAYYVRFKGLEDNSMMHCENVPTIRMTAVFSNAQYVVYRIQEAAE